MRKITANPDRLLLRAQNSTTRLGFQLERLTRVLVSFETLIEQGDQRLAKRDGPEDLNAASRLLWVTNELDLCARNLQALSQHASALREQLPDGNAVMASKEDPPLIWHTQQV